MLVIGGHKVELKVTASPAPDVAKSSQEMVLFKKPSQAVVPQAKPEPSNIEYRRNESRVK